VTRRLYPTLEEPIDLELAYAYVPDAQGVMQPRVRANMVATVDGAASGSDGLSGSISGAADKMIFATLRRLADVVLVGAGTASSEAYRPAALPIAVVSAHLGMDLGSPLYRGAEHRTILITCESAPADRLDQARQVADVEICGDHRVDLDAALGALAARGFDRVLCEGGPSLLRQLAADGLLDELCLTTAPRLAGPGPGRILRGEPLPAGVQLSLTQLIEDQGWLFARYAVRS